MTIRSYISIYTEKDIVKARQEGRDLAKKVGFGVIDQARITTAVSELARNIYIHAKNGKIVIEVIDEREKRGLKIIAKDHGPGIKDIRAALEDGYSTSGGLGVGLPGVKRLMDEFFIDSKVNEGTEIVVIKWLN